MGIKNLLIELRSITEDVHISEYRGLTVAIDGYTWVHKGVFACAEDLANGRHSEKWITFCEKRLALLQLYEVKPYFVFDGNNLPAKQVTETDRQQKRIESLQRARDAKARGDSMAAQGAFSGAVDVSPAMVSIWLDRLRKRGIPFIVAPYEADAQLAFLAINGYVDAVLTEDSDLIPYGVERVLFKMDKEGNGKEIRAEALTRCEELSFANWTDEMVLHMCILAGCDYLPSPPGMALKRAHEFIGKVGKGLDLKRMLTKLQLEKGVSAQYCEAFKQARMTFYYQRVFDPVKRQMVHLRPLPDALVELLRVSPTALDFLGPAVDNETACAIADGLVDPTTMQPYPPPPSETAAGGGHRAFYSHTSAFGVATGIAAGTGQGSTQWHAGAASQAPPSHGSSVPNPNAYRSFGASIPSKSAAVPNKSPILPSAPVVKGQRNIFSMLQVCKPSAAAGAQAADSTPQGQGSGPLEPVKSGRHSIPSVPAKSFFGIRAASTPAASSGSAQRAAPPADIVEIDDDSAPGQALGNTASKQVDTVFAAPGVVRSRHFAVPPTSHKPQVNSTSSSRPIDQLVMDQDTDRQVLVLGERSDQPTGEDPDTEVVSDAAGRLLGNPVSLGGATPSTRHTEGHVGQQLLQHKYSSRNAAGSRLPASLSAGMSSAAMSARHGAASINAKVSAASSVLVGPLQSPPPGRAQGVNRGKENSEPKATGMVRPSVLDRLNGFAFPSSSSTFSTPAPVVAAPVDWEALGKRASEKAAQPVPPVPLSTAASHSAKHRSTSSVIPGTVGPAGVLTGQAGRSKNHVPQAGLGQGGQQALAQTVQASGKKRSGVFGHSPAQGRSPVTRSASKRMRGPPTTVLGKQGAMEGEGDGQGEGIGYLGHRVQLSMAMDTSAILPLMELEEDMDKIEEHSAASPEQLHGVMPTTSYKGMHGPRHAQDQGVQSSPPPMQLTAAVLPGVLHGLNPNILRQQGGSSDVPPGARPARSKGFLDSYCFGGGSPSPSRMTGQGASASPGQGGIMAKFNRRASNDTGRQVQGAGQGRSSKVQLGSGVVNFNVSGL